MRIQIDQTAVTAREVFTGAMEIDNASATDSLMNVQISLQFVDESGNPANDKFTIVGPDLTGLNAADGTGILQAGAPHSPSIRSFPTMMPPSRAPLATTWMGRCSISIPAPAKRW